MRISTRTALITLLLVGLALPALAAGTPVDLPSGETVMLMHPGVDGVEPPWAIRSRMIAPRFPDRIEPLPTGNMVTVAVMVLADGSVAQMEVLGARHPNLGYEEMASNAVSRWKFKPGRKDGEAVNSYVIYNIEFPNPDNLLGIQDLLPTNFGMVPVTIPDIAGPAGGSETLGFSNGSRVSVASTPPYRNGELTDRYNRGQYVGTTDWAAKNGR